MIIGTLSESDKGRNVIYARNHGKGVFAQEVGKLSSWNEKYVFVNFDGWSGIACRPEDVSFEFTEHLKENEE